LAARFIRAIATLSGQRFRFVSQFSMAKPLIHDDFLLGTKQARELYHRFAEDEPIYDYHCHLPPDLIARNHQFADLAELWLGGDHYKWRAMRTNGVKEDFITGVKLGFGTFQVFYSLLKAMLFGAAIAFVCSYEGFVTEAGAEGVGSSTAKAVVITSVTILVLDTLTAAVLAPYLQT
jgi:hypothetical protein